MRIKEDPQATTDEAKDFPYFKSEFVAVFNCHKCDIRKGRAAVIEKFGEEGWKKVKKINRTGVMAMYRISPTPETLLFSHVVGLSADTRQAKAARSVPVIDIHI